MFLELYLVLCDFSTEFSASSLRVVFEFSSGYPRTLCRCSLKLFFGFLASFAFSVASCCVFSEVLLGYLWTLHEFSFTSLEVIFGLDFKFLLTCYLCSLPVVTEVLPEFVSGFL